MDRGSVSIYREIEDFFQIRLRTNVGDDDFRNRPAGISIEHRRADWMDEAIVLAQAV